MARPIILHPDRDNDRVGGSFRAAHELSLTLCLALILITPMNKCINIIARFTPTRLTSNGEGGGGEVKEKKEAENHVKPHRDTCNRSRCRLPARLNPGCVLPEGIVGCQDVRSTLRIPVSSFVPSWRSLGWVARMAKEIYVSRITATFRDEDRSGVNITGANRAVPWREEG